MTFGVLKQIACPTPTTFDAAPPWADVPLRDVVLPRVLELAYTSHRSAPYARDLGDHGPPFRWIPERRVQLRTELDAAMMHVYGLTREEAQHVLDSFAVVRKCEERDLGEFRTKKGSCLNATTRWLRRRRAACRGGATSILRRATERGTTGGESGNRVGRAE